MSLQVVAAVLPGVELESLDGHRLPVPDVGKKGEVNQQLYGKCATNLIRCT